MRTLQAAWQSAKLASLAFVLVMVLFFGIDESLTQVFRFDGVTLEVWRGIVKAGLGASFLAWVLWNLANFHRNLKRTRVKELGILQAIHDLGEVSTKINDPELYAAVRAVFMRLAHLMGFEQERGGPS